MAQNDKVRDLLLKDVEEEIPIYTCFSSYEFDSFIRRYHVYQHIWTPVEGETYSCTREPGNELDCNAVAVMYKDRVVEVKGGSTVFKQLLFRINGWSHLFTPKPLQLTQF